MTDHSALIERLETFDGGHQSDAYRLIDEAAAALRDLTEWRDIATRPSEETFLVIGGRLHSELGGGDPCVEAVKVRYSPADDFQERESFDVVDACYYGLWVENPTHWLPLPSATNQANTEDVA